MLDATNDTRICYRCGFETAEPLDACSVCGYRLRTVRMVRRLGWVLVVLGGAIAAFGIGLSVIVGKIIISTRDPGATTTFTGGLWEIVLIYGVFGFVTAIGAGAVFGGVWQIQYGRPNRKVALGAGVLILVLSSLSRLVRSCEPF